MALPRASAPPVPRPAAAAPQQAIEPVKFGGIQTASGNRVVLYGPGGIGKTTLACLAPGPVAIIDLDDSLPRLWPALREAGCADVRRVDVGESWAEMRRALQSPGWDDVRTIVIDTLTRAEELCVAHTLAVVPNDKGQVVRRIEDYGYGKGYQFVFDEFLPLLGDLDQHKRAGRDVILVCHDCTASVPNPAGNDWIRYEPRLQSPPSGKGSIRLRVREWSDHVLYIGYDVAVSKDGKASGCGSRTIYPTEQPTCMAKSRTITDQIVYEKNSRELWSRL